MIATGECLEVTNRGWDYAHRKLPAPESLALEQHLRTCAGCRKKVEGFAAAEGLLAGALGDGALDPLAEFAKETGRRLAVRKAKSAAEDDEAAAVSCPAPGLADFLQEHLGAAPWWCISGMFHALLLLLLTLIGYALMASSESTVILTDLAKLKEPEKPDPEVKRDIFKKPVEFEASEPQVEVSQVVVHEEVEVADHAETANDMDFNSARGENDAISDVPLAGSGVIAALGLGGGGGGGSFGQRGGGGRRRLATKNGGGAKTESAVDAALEWLARNQEPDGRWDGVKHGASGPCDPAVTGLALLAFLGAGHTEKVGKYKENVKKGIAWLISQQREDGRIPKTEIGHLGYNCAIAGMALAEAAAMGRVPETKAAAQKASDYSVDVHQNGEGSEKFGWRYAAKSKTQDISVSGWFIMQLKSAKVGGLQVDPAAFEGGMKFLDTVEVEKAKPGDPYSGHRYAYTPGQVKDPACNGAIGCLGRQFLGVKPEELQGGVEYFLSKGGVPDWKRPHFYYWYYATLCCFQQGGDVWTRWNEAMKKTLLENQCKGGANDGSWEPIGPWVHQKRGGGRVMSTALGCMCLEVYYRYLPMYRE
ncbi:MAG: zf-HC2 domain-containing protein [Planctomycetota bacterium]|nr:zf-HC2 domain-containing protein [Planctomycetota bacterium]